MIKRVVAFLLMLALLVPVLPALAEESGITLEVKTDKLPVYSADDPCLAGLLAPLAEDAEALPVLVLPLKKNWTLNVSVLPRNAKNRRFATTAADDTVVRAKGNSVTGLALGETVITIAAEADPSAAKQFRVLVVQPANRVAVVATEKKVAVGGTLQLYADLSPATASMKAVTWTSSDERIATVAQDGTVTGVKRGSVRITAATMDGSNVRASVNLQVNQNPESVTLDRTEATVAAGRSVTLKATVLPKDTNDKNVTWTSTDTAVATVNGQGKVVGVALGDCQIICASRVTGEVQAVADIHVTQPVKNIAFGPAPEIYVGETARVTWTVDPANASNQAVTLSSSNRNVLQVAVDGTITGVKAGEAYVNAVSTDGTNRQARLKVRVMQHVTGVHMKRRAAYIDPKESCTVTAIIEPNNASNQNMTWYMVEDDIAEVSLANKAGTKVKIRGLQYGITTLVGRTEDGGFETRLSVNIGDWDHALRIREAQWGKLDNMEVYLRVENQSNLRITKVIAEVEILDSEGKGVPCNSKDPAATKYRMEYRRTLNPGEITTPKYWKQIDFQEPTALNVATYRVTIYQYVVDDDWIKTIREYRRPKKDIPIHI